jgi:hypothetical protein
VPDFFVRDCYSLVMVLPQAPAAEQWVEDHVSPEGFHPNWPDLVVEPRYLDDLLEGVQSDGLTVVEG